MTEIHMNTGYSVLINVFTVEPARQQELIDLLVEATEDVMRHLPGFISANLHKSPDGTRVANYAQWRTEADWRAMLKNPEAQKHMKQAVEISQPAFSMYDLVHVEDRAAVSTA
jgi:heme-degrading monooxygenase HmoA